MKKEAFANLVQLLYGEFCHLYGKIISKTVVKDFLNQVDDLREVNFKYVYYLHDYVVDYDLIGN